MSRRLEVTVPNDWAPPVRDILESDAKCGFNSTSGKPNMIAEMKGVDNTIFFVTIPGPAVSSTLEQLRKNGIGVAVGRIILSSIDYMKPDLAKPLTSADASPDNIKAIAVKKAAPLKGISHFQKARKTTEEMYNEISNNANMNINTWMNLIGASVIAAGGLTTNMLVFVVAAMLVSPIMGPILGMVMGYRVADFKLFKIGLINEIKMAIAAYCVGICFGLILGRVGDTYKWPNSAMMPEGQGFNMIISIIVSAAAGMVLGVSLTSAGGNALVGTAISAGLLPPLVNAGMLMSYSYVYAPKEKSWDFYEMGIYAVLFYISHVITIFFVANFVFWLKAIDPRFKEGEDSNFEDCPSLVEHKRLLEEEGKDFNEREKAEFFFNNLRNDLQKDLKKGVFALKDNMSGMAHTLTGGLVGHQHQNSQHYDEEDPSDTVNPLQHRQHPHSHSHSQQQQPPQKHMPRISEEGVEMTQSSAKSSRSRRLHGDRFTAVNLQDDEESGLAVDANGYIEPSSTPSSSARLVHSASSDFSLPSSNARDEVIAFYREHNPEKLSSVDEILVRYAGKERELLSKLHKQYNIPQSSKF